MKACQFDTKLTDYCAPKKPRDAIWCASLWTRRGGGIACRVLLLADGLAPSRRRALRDRRSSKAAVVAYTHGLFASS